MTDSEYINSLCWLCKSFFFVFGTRHPYCILIFASLFPSLFKEMGSLWLEQYLKPDPSSYCCTLNSTIILHTCVFIAEHAHRSTHYRLTMVHGWRFDNRVHSGVMPRKLVTIIGQRRISFFDIPLWDVWLVSYGPFTSPLVLPGECQQKVVRCTNMLKWALISLLLTVHI